MKNTMIQTFNQKMSTSVPMPFWKQEEPNEQSHKQLTAHEVKYNHTDPNSATYNVYIDPFDSGMPEQWLNFQTKLRIIIRGNGLDENGPVRFNLMRALLNDDAPLRLFDERASKLTANKDGYTENKTDDILCLHSLTEHVFPYQVLQSQKCHMAAQS